MSSCQGGNRDAANEDFQLPPDKEKFEKWQIARQSDTHPPTDEPNRTGLEALIVSFSPLLALPDNRLRALLARHCCWERGKPPDHLLSRKWECRLAHWECKYRPAGSACHLFRLPRCPLPKPRTRRYFFYEGTDRPAEPGSAGSSPPARCR